MSLQSITGMPCASNRRQIGQRLNNALAAIEDANLRLRGVFGDVDFANQDRFSDALLEKLLTHFEKHRLRNADAALLRA